MSRIYYKDQSITPPPLKFCWKVYEFFRSSHRMCFMKKAAPKNFATFTGKLQACNFIENRLQYRCFPLNIAQILSTPISKNPCLVSNCFCIDSFIKFRYLLTGYEQLSYNQFNQNLSICVSLGKDWFMLPRILESLAL